MSLRMVKFREQLIDGLLDDPERVGALQREPLQFAGKSRRLGVVGDGRLAGISSWMKRKRIRHAC